MLEGEAKTAYMREYMRRKRAGLPTVKPKKEWEPPWWMPHNIAVWARHRAGREPWRVGCLGHKVIDGLKLDTDESVMEACRRYKAILDEQRAARKTRKQAAAEPPPPKRCSFCDKPASKRRILVGDRYTFICQQCATKAAHKAEQARKRRKS
jgi:hypothetical protein